MNLADPCIDPMSELSARVSGPASVDFAYRVSSDTNGDIVTV